MWNSLWLAVMFLTRFPSPKLHSVSEPEQGRVMLFFPLVGAGIGVLLCVCMWLLPADLPLLNGALVLLVWVFATGGLHLDGLADSADAWLGGLGDKARTLEIMKDPRAGSGALMAVTTLLLVKFAALASTKDALLWVSVLLVPIIGRCVPAILFFTTPYARPQGLASTMLAQASRPKNFLCIGLVLSAVTLGLLPFLGLHLILFWSLLALQLMALRQLMLSRIDGVTGDTVGAAVEITEMWALVLMVVLGG